MADLSGMSNEELFAIAGMTPKGPSAPTAAPTLSSMSNDELFKIAGVAPKAPSSGGIMSGISNFFWPEGSGYAPPSGIGNALSNFASNVVDPDAWLTRGTGERISAKQAVTGPLVRAAEAGSFGLGEEVIAGGNAVLDDLASALTGGPAGDYDARLQEARNLSKDFSEASPGTALAIDLAMMGKAPLPNVMSSAKGVKATAGNVAKGAGVGAGMGGAYGFGTGEGGLENRLENAKSGAAFGAAFGGAGQAVSEGLQGAGSHLSKIAGALDEGATGLKEKGLGVSYGDVKGGLGRKQAVYLDDAGNPTTLDKATDVTSSVQQRLQALEESGFFKKAPDEPGALAAYTQKSRIAAGDKVRDMIKKTDEALEGRPVTPSFSRLEKFYNSLKESDQVKYQKTIGELFDDFEKTPGSGVSKVVTFKQRLQDDAGFEAAKDSKKAELFKAAYMDLKEAAEETVDKVFPPGSFRKANEVYGAHETVLKTLPARGAKNAPNLVEYIGRPAGSLPFWIASSVLNPALAAKLLLAQAGGRYVAASKPMSVARGMEKASDLLGTPAGAISKAGESISGAAPRVAGAGEFTDEPEQPKDNLSTISNALLEPSQPVKMSGEPLAEALKNVSAQGFPMAPKSKPAQTSSKVDETLVKAVIAAESSGNPKATGPKTKYGGARAQGLMQLMPATGKELFRELKLEGEYDPYDPELNKKLGTYYLEKMMRQFGGDVRLALAAYNWGPGNLSKHIKAVGSNDWTVLARSPKVPKETRDYVTKVLKKREALLA